MKYERNMRTGELDRAIVELDDVFAINGTYAQVMEISSDSQPSSSYRLKDLIENEEFSIGRTALFRDGTYVGSHSFSKRTVWIINGLDVSGCPALNKNSGVPQCSELRSHFPTALYCKDCINCLYKRSLRDGKALATANRAIASLAESMDTQQDLWLRRCSEQADGFKRFTEDLNHEIDSFYSYLVDFQNALGQEDALCTECKNRLSSIREKVQRELGGDCKDDL